MKASPSVPPSLLRVFKMRSLLLLGALLTRPFGKSLLYIYIALKNLFNIVKSSMSTFFCALKDFVSQFKVPRNPTWWKLKGRMQDLRRQNLNFRNTIMQIIMDMTIIAHNRHHRNNHHNCHNRQI